MSVQLNGITFSNINTTDNVGGYGTKKTKTALISNNKYSETKLSNMINAVNNGNTTWDKVAFINGVDIDWNGAEITSTAFPSMDRTINTTGDLLSWIKEGIEEAAVSGRTSGVVRRSLWIN